MHPEDASGPLLLQARKAASTAKGQEAMTGGHAGFPGLWARDPSAFRLSREAKTLLMTDRARRVTCTRIA